MHSKNGSLRGSVLLFITAFIWGTAFVAQSVSTDFVGPFTFNMARSVLGGAFLIPVILLMGAGRKKKSASCPSGAPEASAEDRKALWTGGICCGAILFVASNLQQWGLQYTTAGKAGFITALYILLVPIFSIFLHKKAGIRLWISVAIAVVGLYFLCMTESFTIQKGDFIEMLCAVAFTFHILVIDHFSPRVDGVKMSCIQFWVAALLSGIGMLLAEDPDWSMIFAAWFPICYVGIMSSGVAYTLQIVGQKDLNPTVASLIMSLESVIAALSAWVLIHQNMSGREVLGCVLMFAAIILAQLPERTPVKSEN